MLLHFISLTILISFVCVSHTACVLHSYTGLLLDRCLRRREFFFSFSFPFLFFLLDFSHAILFSLSNKLFCAHFSACTHPILGVFFFFFSFFWLVLRCLLPSLLSHTYIRTYIPIHTYIQDIQYIQYIQYTIHTISTIHTIYTIHTIHTHNTYHTYHT
jgi:hypothetical protein